MRALLTLNSEPDVQLYKHKVSHYSTVRESPYSLRKRVFVCIEMLINCSNRLHSDHWGILFNESISSCSIHVHSPSGQTDSNCQPQSLPPLTVGPIKAWMFWSDSLTQFFTWRKRRTNHNAINHQRVSGGQLVSQSASKKPYLLSSICSAWTCV